METKDKLAWYDANPHTGMVVVIVALLLAGFVAWRRTGELGWMVVLSSIAAVLLMVEIYASQF